MTKLEYARFTVMSSNSQQVVIVGRDPTPRRRLDENKPEERRSLILAALEASAATIEHADPTEGSDLVS